MLDTLPSGINATIHDSIFGCKLLGTAILKGDLMRLRKMIQRVALGVVALMFALSAQDVKPTCNHCSATYIPSDELQAYVIRAVTNGLVDQQVRSVDIGKSQIGIGVV